MPFISISNYFLGQSDIWQTLWWCLLQLLEVSEVGPLLRYTEEGVEIVWGWVSEGELEVSPVWFFAPDSGVGLGHHQPHLPPPLLSPGSVKGEVLKGGMGLMRFRLTSLSAAVVSGRISGELSFATLSTCILCRWNVFVLCYSIYLFTTPLERICPLLFFLPIY